MHIIGPFFYGIGTGFLMSVLLGVIFFMLIQAGLKYHWKKGFNIAAGVITGDIIYVILAISFTGAIAAFLAKNEHTIAIVGGVILLIMGVAAILKKRQIPGTDEKISSLKNARDFYFKPLLINLVNPANAAWWLGLYSMPPALHYATDQKIIFAAGAICTVFFTEVGVAATASKLKKYITPATIHKVDVGVGILLMAVGVRLVLKGTGIG